MFLKKKIGCDFVICLSHLGLQYDSNKISDIKLATKTKNIDLIIGGHTHSFLNEPVIVKNSLNKDVIISQAGFGAIKLGKIDFYFDKKCQIMQKLIPQLITLCWMYMPKNVFLNDLQIRL